MDVEITEEPAPPSFAAPLAALSSLSTDRSSPAWKVRATKRVTIDDPYMRGHFPGLSIYPGVFILETLRQAVASAVGSERCWPEIRCVRSARFLAPLVPGDLLVVTFNVTQTAAHGVFDVDATCMREDAKSVARLKVCFEIPDE